MLHNLIFDFGGVLINLDLEAVPRGLGRFGIGIPDPGLVQVSQEYEKGRVGTAEFLSRAQEYLPGSHPDEIIGIWNETIADFPAHRLEYLETLRNSGRYRMFLLSNTNALHMEQVQVVMGAKDFRRFQNCFEGFYLSHEIGMRKPEREIFEFVLDRNGLTAAETLFIDDTREHTDSAALLGIRTWHLKVGQEEILELNSWLD